MPKNLKTSTNGSEEKPWLNEQIGKWTNGETDGSCFTGPSFSGKSASKIFKSEQQFCRQIFYLKNL